MSNWIHEKNRGHILMISLTKWDKELGHDVPRHPSEGIAVSVTVPFNASAGGFVTTTVPNMETLRRLSDDLCSDFIAGMLEWFDWRPKKETRAKPKPKPTSAATLALLDDLDLDL